MKASITVDVKEVEKSLSRISDDVPKALTRGINDAAFALRKTWLQLIEQKVDNPVSFTKKVFVSKASPEKQEAIVYIPPIQSTYLHFLVEGGIRRGGDYGNVGKGELLSPVKGMKLNKWGNFPQSPKRYLGRVDDGHIKNTFIGSPSAKTDEGKNKRAVYQKMKDGKLKLLAVFINQQKYKPTLPLYEESEKFGATIQEKLSNEINKLLQ